MHHWPRAFRDLKDEPRWVTTRGKVPLTPLGGAASSTDPHTWHGLPACVARVGRDGVDGVGLVLVGGGLVCLDVDHVVDPATGAVPEDVSRLVEDLSTYTEISCSGTGLHVWVHGAVPGGKAGGRFRLRSSGREVEIYATKRYIKTGLPLRALGAGAEVEAVDLSALVEPIAGRATGAATPEGGRNDTLFRVACAARAKGADEAAVLAAVEAANATCDPPLEAEELARIAASACRYDQGTAEGFGTELWMARRIVAEHGGDLRYVERWRKWLAYDPATGRWAESEAAAVRAAKQTARGLLREAEERLRVATSKEDIAAAEAWTAAGRRYYSRSPLANALSLASSELEVAATVEQWDADPWVLAVGGGRVVDLRTGAARAATRADYLTRGTDVPYDPAAPAPTWERFLARVLPEAAVPGYVQRLAGYCAIGEVREHVLHVFHGGGRNGKGTFTEALAYALGDYAIAVPAALLLESRGDRHPTDLADLCGRRLATCSEAPEGGRLSEERVKWLTGGDRIRARRMREDPWEFVPSHKIVLSTNHRPRIAGTDLGVWRRLRLVAWGVTIREDEEDVTLPARLRAEAPGVLAWIVAGAVEYARVGLRPPAAVLAATSDYRQGEDVLGDFISEHVLATPGAFIASGALHDRYVEWAAEAGVARPWGQRTLTTKMKDRGYAYSTKPRGYRGVSLSPRSERGSPVDFKAESPRNASYGIPRSERGKNDDLADWFPSRDGEESP